MAFALGLVLALVPLVANSQVAITSVNGFVYKQDFNSLAQANVAFPNIALPGWQLSGGASTTLTADDGSTDGSGYYNYGSTGSSDRSLGFQGTGNKAGDFRLAMKNTTGSPIKYFKISYRAEVWRKTVGNSSPIDFSVSTDQSTFTNVDALDAETYISDNGGAINGNQRFVQKSFIIRNAPLAANGTIWFNWTLHSKWGISIDDVVIEPVNVVDFYNKAGEDLALLTSWETKLLGQTIQPLSFSDADQVFRIENPTAITNGLTLSTHLPVTGVDSKLVIGDGTTRIQMTLAGGQTLKGTVDILDHATLIINTPQVPVFGQLSSGSTVVFEKGAPSVIQEGTEFGRVIFNTANTNKFSKKVKIKGQLTLQNSTLELGDNDLELAAGATIVNSSPRNYIKVNGKGRVRKALKAGEEALLPVGNATYNPVKIKLASGSQEDVFSVGIMEGVYGTYTNDLPNPLTLLSENLVSKTWVVSEDVKGGSDITLTLSWSALDVLPGFNKLNCHIKHYENGVWDTVESTAALLDPISLTYSVSRSGIKSFSPFTVANRGEPGTIIGGPEPFVLPVELINFLVKAKANTVALTWATASEKDNDYFAVERSIDGKNFTEVGQVKGNGTSQVRNEYSFTDYHPMAGTSYYRLRQVDFDGQHEYSPVRSVNAQNSQVVSLSLYPNPTQGTEVTWQMQGLAPGEEATVILTDITGRNVLQRTLPTGGTGVLATAGLKAGTYLVTVHSRAGAKTQRLVVR
ncbi:T9SS type A sorting domain-containing protein [Rufibacter glacialis]|nr:T9SS type A sorting domain-containing protein [Rufibacter glacialis]GGK59641.1 hypothetical protein GCM10011405_04730 [Rufibacter glacialis]